MKKLLTIALTVILAVVSMCSLTACGKEDLNFGKDLVKLDSQLDTLTQLKSGTIDMSIIDSVMAGYYATTGEFKDDIVVLNKYVLANEQYGIAGRKGDKAFVSKINDALIALQTTDYATIAETYGLTSSLSIDANTTNPLASETDGSWDAIKTAGKIVIGYTVFAPIAYELVDNVPTKGFDIELAKKVVAYLNTTYSVNLTVQFQEIDWDSKEVLLNNGTIDLIWNGLTITSERAANMCISVPYLNNNQVAVVRKADYNDQMSYKDLFTLFATATIGVEGGSAGESVVLASDK
jgi:ABC-type amino acid transport substrate-binding protein